MSSTVRSLLVRIGVDADNAGLKRFDSGLKGIGNQLNKLKPLMLGFGAAASFAFGGILKKGAQLEQYEIAFQTMLGSTEKAVQLMGDLRKLTLETPFKFEETIKGAKQLVAAGFGVQEVSERLRNLGNIAAGVGKENFPFLIKALQDVKTKGFLQGPEIKQFRNAVVDITGAIGKEIGKTSGQVEEMASKRLISYKMVEQALDSMTKKGALFHNLMLKQSKTLGGVWSVFQDTISMTAMDIGRDLVPQAKDMVKVFMEFIKNNKELIKLAITDYFKSFVDIITNVINKVRDLGNFFIEVFGGSENALKVLTTGLKIFNHLQGVLRFRSVQRFLLIT